MKRKKGLALLLAGIMALGSVLCDNPIGVVQVKGEETKSVIESERPDDQWENKASIAEAGKYKEIDYSFLKNFSYRNFL